LKQLALAVHNYHSRYNVIPPSACIDAGGFASNNASWSVHGRILPEIDRGVLADRVDLTRGWDDQPLIDGLKIGTFSCPSDPLSDVPRTFTDDRPDLYPTTYGFNHGTWLVWDPTRGGSQGVGGDGPFYPNSRLALDFIPDGTTNTLMIAEVKAFTPYFRNIDPPAQYGVGGAVPDDPATLVAFAEGGQKKMGDQNSNTGHTEWPDGRVHHAGFTTVFTPNTVVPYVDSSTGQEYDVDYSSQQEGKQRGGSVPPTLAAITSRSHHEGQVQVALMDGSVRSVNDTIALAVWRAVGSRDGGEVTEAL